MKMRLWCQARSGRALKTLAWTAVLGLGLMGTAMAQTIQPITWNVVGLDSNNVSVGPNVFPVGARVCNNTLAPVAANAWQAKFNWVTSSTYIDRTSPQQLPVGALAVGAVAFTTLAVSAAATTAATSTTTIATTTRACTHAAGKGLWVAIISIGVHQFLNGPPLAFVTGGDHTQG